MIKTPRLYALILALAWTLAALPALAAPKVGDAPPDLVGRQLDGKGVRLSQFAGKAIVLSFWATWCPYCMQEMPILNNIQRTVGKDRMQVIAVNVEKREVFRKVARALSTLDLEVAYDPDRDGQDGFDITSLPHMIIVGRDGKIVAIYKGYNKESLDDIVASLNQALAAKPEEEARAEDPLRTDIAHKDRP